MLARQQSRHQQRTVLAARKARCSGPVLSEEQKRKQAEERFVRDLQDACPRCGVKPHESSGNIASQRRAHLRACTDAALHKAYAKKQRRDAAPQEARAEATRVDEEVGDLARWKMLGGAAQSAWQLTDKNLEKACEAKGVDAGGSREEQLARLAAAEASDVGDGQQPPRLTTESAPVNLHGMSLEQLRCVCAAHAIVPPADSSVDELVALLEARSDAHAHVDGGLEPEPKRLCNGAEEEEEEGEAKEEEEEEDEEDEEDDDE